MNESGRKRREWVKTAAIIFLSIMLVLTFFSNTIMNHSLPEVATQYVMNGTITAKIRGTGVIESGDPYNVEVTYSRKVASVAVREGDKVEKGDVLFYLEDEESQELQAALAALENAKKAYDKALLNVQLTSSDIKEANSGVTAEDFRKKITNYQYLIQTEENKIAPLEAKIVEIEGKIAPLKTKKADLEQIISDINTQLTYENANDSTAQTRVNATKKAMQYAEDDKNVKASALASAEQSRESIAAKLEEAKKNSVSDGNAAAQVPVLEEQLKAADENVAAKTQEHNDAVNTYNFAVTSYNNALKEFQDRDSSQVHANLNQQKSAYQIELYGIERDMAGYQNEIALVEADIAVVEAKKLEYETELNEMQGRMNNVLGLSEYIAAVEEAQAEVDKLNEKSYDATVTAPISGTVSSINVTAGENTTAAVPVAVMQPEGKGYTLSFTVTNEQAKKLSVGDRADLVNAWRYEDVEVTLASIKVDKNNPSQQKVLTFDVTGSVVAGQSLTVSVGQKSATYDYIVPNSAIREDNNGQFILIVESKSSPLGTRYTASRVDVQVIASDDTQSAITGGVMGYEFVITTSTKPVQAGELVRLAD